MRSKHVHRQTFNRPVAKPKRTRFNGETLDSKGEATRFASLRLLLLDSERRLEAPRTGDIRNLERQPKLPLVVNGKKIGRGYYRADFKYEEWRDLEWRVVFEDYKGFDTPLSRLRRQLAEACNDVVIRITT